MTDLRDTAGSTSGAAAVTNPSSNPTRESVQQAMPSETAQADPVDAGPPPARLSIERLNFWYGPKQALFDIDLDIYDREVLALIGASGCGKSTLLRCLNRMNDTIEQTRLEGRILMDGQDVYAKDIDPTEIRRRFGWVAQKPNPFPRTVYENVAYGARLRGFASTRKDMDALVERSLSQAGLWDEVKDRLQTSGAALSGGQQQRLCIARALATRPDVILMDEPCSALDPIATARVEELIEDLKADYPIVIVTHNMQQAARISQRTAFFHLGVLRELEATEKLFMNPEDQLCEGFISGRFG
ncbi:MAG: phosphate ABC transporter ATP-binding protein PstB [Acetobacterales bacterium]